MIDFYSRFKAFDDAKLFSMVIHPEDYQAEAVATALRILNERGLEAELAVKLQERQRLLEEQEQTDYALIVQRAAYYKDLVKAKEQGVYFDIALSEVPVFEGQLADRGISFFKEDKNIGPGIEMYPVQRYFFDPKDAEVVDVLVKKIGLNVAPYYSDRAGAVQMVGLIVMLLAMVLFIMGAIIFG